jgi:ADP-ribose pyrophosphatase YjhB (NUDIX family)
MASVLEPEKVGAGLLLACQGEVLLLLRRSLHNDLTWGLPGGNREEQDGGQLEATALREATEEMGPLPPLTVSSSHLTRRGRFSAKQYTVFVCRVEPAVRAAWTPVLNHEHREHRWFTVSQVSLAVAGVTTAPAPLHPVVAALLQQHPDLAATLQPREAAVS